MSWYDWLHTKNLKRETITQVAAQLTAHCHLKLK